MKRICLILVLCMIFSLLGGCGASNAPSDTTLDTVEPTTVPTTLPPETLPPETTSPTTLPPEAATEEIRHVFQRDKPSERQLKWEKQFNLEYYTAPGLCTLRDPGQEFDFQDGSGMTLTIPDDWVGRVVVFEVVNDFVGTSGPYIGSITIVSKALMEAYWEYGIGCMDYSITLERVDKRAYYSEDADGYYRPDVEDGKATKVGEDDEFVYVVYTDGSLPPRQGDPRGHSRGYLKELITEEGYQQAVGDITCTLEEAAAMCSMDEIAQPPLYFHTEE